MAIAFFWFVFSIAVGMWAHNKGHSGIGWFFLALLISPLIGGVLCAVASNRKADALIPTAATHVKCPACAEFVLPEAIKCKHCGGALTPQATPPNDRDTGEAIRNIFILLGIVGFVAMVLSIASKQ